MNSTTNAMDIKMSITTMSTVATSVSKADFTKRTSGQASASFDGFLNKVSDTMVQAKKIDTGKKFDPNKASQNQPAQGKDNKTISNDNKVDNDNKQQLNDDKNIKDDKTVETNTNNAEKPETENVKNVNETDSKEANTKLQEAIEEDGKKLLSEIAKAMDISEDEIINAMQQLGLSVVDLLDPQNIQNLITELGGQDKALDLLTNADLNTMMQDLYEGANGMRSELTKEFDLSKDGLEAAIKDFDEKLVKVDKSDVEKEPQIVLHKVADELTGDLKAPQSNDLSSRFREKPISEMEVESDVKPIEITNQASKQNGQSKGGDLSGNAQGQNLFNQLLNNLTENINAPQTGPAEYTNRAQMENILRQITERITISQGTDESSMELQLHPASLGNVNILLTSSKDGITAKFTAQNEIVKEAVESQMMALQQKFNEQGIKVTSIEVTIASHAFEQNLQQGNDGNSSYEEHQAKTRKTLRRINLAEVDEIDDEAEMSDGDRIAAQMMAANGNSVDFSA